MASPWHLLTSYSEDSIKLELQKERPIYILSAFGPAKHEPNLFFGNDVQPEELRWKSVQAIKQGNVQAYASSGIERAVIFC